MNKKNNQIKSGVTMGADYWISYTDIMTALLFIFILIIFVLMLNHKSLVSKLEVLDTLSKEQLEVLNSLSKEQLEVLDSLSKEKLDMLSEFTKLKSKYKDLQESYDKALRDKLVLSRENKRIKEENIKLSEFKKDWDDTDREILDMLRRIRDELNNVHKIKVQLDETNKTLNIDSNVLGFESGEYEIQQQYKNGVVNVISNILKREIDNYRIKNKIDAIFIEGYTDDRPLPKPGIFGNWGLSALRAISFWKTLNQFNDLSNIKNPNSNKFMFSFSGYANVRPIECTDYVSSLDFQDYSYYFLDNLGGYCREYQSCVAKHLESPEVCRNGKYLNYKEQQIYDTKNRRIGIRFIPYHKIDTK